MFSSGHPFGHSRPYAESIGRRPGRAARARHSPEVIMIPFSRTAIGSRARTLTAALAILALVPGLAHAVSPTQPTVPVAIQVPSGNVPFLLGHATGTQNYACQRS